MSGKNSSRILLIVLITPFLLAVFSPFIQAVNSTQISSASIPISSEIRGIILNMWFDDNGCYFRIEITWSNNSLFDGKTVNSRVEYWNPEIGDYEEKISSSRGWKIGDDVNGVLWYQFDYNNEWYWLQTYSKGDFNYAIPTINSSISLFQLGWIILPTIIIVYCLYRIKRKEINCKQN
jgi:hypothetical protein